MTTEHAKEAQRTMAGSGCVIRLAWMAIGHVVLFFAIIFIVRDNPGIASAYDAVFWGGVLAILGLRYIDIKWLNGLTATGNEPASMTHWRKHALLLLIIGLVLWLGAHAAAYVAK